MQTLREFIDDVIVQLEWLAANAGWCRSKREHDLFRAAWDEIKKQGATAELKRGARDNNRDPVLTKVGLGSGSPRQLALKLHFYGRARADWLTARGLLESKPELWSLAGRWWKRVLRKFLKWLDLILESALVAIPGGEAVKEFKEAIEELLDDEGEGEGEGDGPDEASPHDDDQDEHGEDRNDDEGTLALNQGGEEDEPCYPDGREGRATA